MSQHRVQNTYLSAETAEQNTQFVATKTAFVSFLCEETEGKLLGGYR